jgi:hypothetical protein
MSTTKNSSYRVHVQDTTEAEVASVNIENGAMLRTDSALYMGHNGSNVVVYPQNVITVKVGQDTMIQNIPHLINYFSRWC